MLQGFPQSAGRIHRLLNGLLQIDMEPNETAKLRRNRICFASGEQAGCVSNTTQVRAARTDDYPVRASSTQSRLCVTRPPYKGLFAEQAVYVFIDLFRFLPVEGSLVSFSERASYSQWKEHRWFSRRNWHMAFFFMFTPNPATASIYLLERDVENGGFIVDTKALQSKDLISFC